LLLDRKDVDDRHKAGHDKQASVARMASRRAIRQSSTASVSYRTTSSLTFATPLPTMPSASAAE
jgi:hypothetical protein